MKTFSQLGHPLRGLFDQFAAEQQRERDIQEARAERDHSAHVVALLDKRIDNLLRLEAALEPRKS